MLGALIETDCKNHEVRGHAFENCALGTLIHSCLLLLTSCLETKRAGPDTAIARHKRFAANQVEKLTCWEKKGVEPLLKCKTHEDDQSFIQEDSVDGIIQNMQKNLSAWTRQVVVA